MAENRTGAVQRKTGETEVEVLKFDLDGTGKNRVETGIPFFNHLLELFAKHGRFDLEITATGDIEVDFHHLVEDTGIVMGMALKNAMGDKRGIRRYASVHIPMDEALVRVCIDLSGRPFLSYHVDVTEPAILHFDAQLAEEFFRAFVHAADITLHLDLIRGRNAHHIVEAAFKGFGVALRDATEVRYEGEIPSTKGVL
jgi:imidazoleglycerol-phosphate dehydratase